jgi:hypothetical protein
MAMPSWYRERIIIPAAACLTVAVSLYLRFNGWRWNDGKVFMIGFMSLFLVNPVFFVANVVAAMIASREAKDEEEFAAVMGPVLDARVSPFRGIIVVFCQTLIWLNVGFVLGQLVVMTLRGGRAF